MHYTEIKNKYPVGPEQSLALEALRFHLVALNREPNPLQQDVIHRNISYCFGIADSLKIPWHIQNAVVATAQK